MSIVNYYEKLKQLRDVLANYDHPPTCKCEGCTCDLDRFLTRNEKRKWYIPF